MGTLRWRHWDGTSRHDHCQISDIICTESQNSNVSCLILQLSLPSPLKPGVNMVPTDFKKCLNWLLSWKVLYFSICLENRQFSLINAWKWHFMGLKNNGPRNWICVGFFYPSAQIGLEGYCRRLPGGRALPHTVTTLPGAVLIGSWSNLVGTILGAGSRTNSFMGDLAR